MSGSTSIQWTDASWSPVVGCTRVSAGCDHCYAAKMTRRLEAMGQEKYKGLSGRGHFNGVARLHAPSLDWPLRWRGAKTAKAEGRPSRIFVNPMSDLFHERLSDEEIAAVFGVMAACPQHVFQVLTKRPERARKWFEWLADWANQGGMAEACTGHANEQLGLWGEPNQIGAHGTPWPLPNVWLGVSVEDQVTADERIPLLLQCPAAVRFVSYEPALGAVDFTDISTAQGEQWDALRSEYDDNLGGPGPRLDWLIVGGESGPGARPFDLAWARAVVEQCREAGVACFVKQMGRRVFGNPEGFLVDRYILDGGAVEWQPPIIGFDKARFRRDNADRICGFKLFDHKGGDWGQWPEDLRVREFPVEAKP